MAKDLPVTLDGKVIYHIKLTDSFQGLAEELKQLFSYRNIFRTDLIYAKM